MERLWNLLDHKSPIASRLYEFLLLNFHACPDTFRINYPNLAQMLPVRPEPYLSDAKRQLALAFELLNQHGVLASAAWAESKQGTPQLLLARGPRLPAGSGSTLTPLTAESDSHVQVRELRNRKAPESFLVADFYRRWTGAAFCHPTQKDLQLARELIALYGLTKAQALIPQLAKRLKREWPEAKTFGATASYIAEVAKNYDRSHQPVAHDPQTVQPQLQTAARNAKDEAALQLLWQSLSDQEREDIRRRVLQQQPRGLQKFPQIVERFCLQELAHRRAD